MAWSALGLCHLWHVHPTSAGVAVMAPHKLSASQCGGREMKVVREQVDPDSSTTTLWEKGKEISHPNALKDALGHTVLLKGSCAEPRSLGWIN